VVQHPEVACISFTGSSATGKWIAAEASRQTLKRVSLECGGKSAFLVSAHSHAIEDAAACLAKNAFYNQGQICSAPTRAYVDEVVFDRFISQLANEAKKYAPSDPISGNTNVGRMIHRQSVARVVEAIVSAVGRGYKKITSEPVSAQTCSVTPTIFLDVPEADPLSQTELFGPVLIVNPVKNMNEAVARANASVYGLAASIWTDDLNEALSVSARLEAGTVHVNSYGEDGNQIPFGGIKNSGIGKEKSVDTLSSYSHVKSICIRLSSRGD
jgi:acyl-CoA reductase-like NAD-dependent aldehyde dehydrogenase